jgi:hypothetical protein
VQRVSKPKSTRFPREEPGGIQKFPANHVDARKRKDTTMAYSVKSKKNGTEYYLHGKPAANGKTTIYFFAKEPKDGAKESLPEGYEVSENSLTGLPILKKKRD